MGKKWNIGLIALNVCLLIVLLIRFEPFTTNDIAYLSLIATLIGIMVAFGVGFQIYGMINVNEKNKELEKQNKKLKKALQELNEFRNNIKSDFGDFKNETAQNIEDHDKKQSLLHGHVNLLLFRDFHSRNSYETCLQPLLTACDCYFYSKDLETVKGFIDYVNAIRVPNLVLGSRSEGLNLLNKIEKNHSSFIIDSNFEKSFQSLRDLIIGMTKE